MKSTRQTWGGLAAAFAIIAMAGCFDESEQDATASVERPAASAGETAQPEAADSSNAVPDPIPAKVSAPSQSPPASFATDGGKDPDAETPTLPAADVDEAPDSDQLEKPPIQLEPPSGARRIDPEFEVWIDPVRRAVITHGIVSFREGPLEMFACTRGTKEHESVVSVNTSAELVHIGLLNLGAESGQPVRFLPEFHPPTGTEIDIQVEWQDEQGQQRTARAQEWVRDARTRAELEHPWVFAGSGFWRDQAGKNHYQAEAGDFICVSNFASATLDIPVESTQANEGLAFEAFTERIPPLGTPVRLVLTPRLTPQEERDDEKSRPPL